MSQTGLSSLLKYRYQSSKEKLGSNNNHEQDISESSQSQSQGSVPDSPVMTSKKRGVTRLLSESEDDQEENSAAENQNGDAPSRPQHNISPDATHREKVTGLKTVFPQEPKWHIENILAMVKGDVERAIDEILKESKWERMSNKQKWHVHPGSTTNSQSSQGSMSPDVQPPPRKRIKRLDSGSSDESPTVAPLVIQPDVPSTSKPKVQVRDLDELKKQVDTLEEAYPHIIRQVLYQKLKENEYDVEKALAVLGDMEANSNEAKKTLSEGKNVGSIKAFQEARKAASISTNDENPIVVSPERPAKERKHYVAKVRKKLEDHEVIALDDDVDDKEFSGSESEEDEDDDPAENKPIIDFFNDATEEELVSMPNCSKKKKVPTATLR